MSATKGRVAGPDPVQGAQAVRRAIAVLRLVACGQERGVRVSDIAAMSGLSRPTVHRLLKVLVHETAVEQDPETRCYRVGPELALLGLARTSRSPLDRIAEPYLRALADQVGDSVFLTVRHGADSVCIQRTLGHHAIQVLSIDVGVRRPLGASVSGIVLLASLTAAAARDVIGTNATRLVLAGHDPADVSRRVDAARSHGHTYAPTGVMQGTSALGVPVAGADGEVVAAISVAALKDRLDRKRLPTVLRAAVEQSAMITRRLAEIEQARRRSKRAAG